MSDYREVHEQAHYNFCCTRSLWCVLDTIAMCRSKRICDRHDRSITGGWPTADDFDEDGRVRELAREESAALAAKRIREALADPDHVGPLLGEALILLRCFEEATNAE